MYAMARQIVVRVEIQLDRAFSRFGITSQWVLKKKKDVMKDMKNRRHQRPEVYTYLRYGGGAI